MKLFEAASNKNFPRYSLKGCTCFGIAISIYDGDTCDLLLCLPNEENTIKRFRVRMMGYNSPEIRQPLLMDKNEKRIRKATAIAAKDKLWSLLGGNTNEILKVECHNWDKYGRLLAKVYRINNNSQYVEYCINDIMAEENTDHI
jgi:endonuclease YncB( thermonuclease family)